MCWYCWPGVYTFKNHYCVNADHSQQTQHSYNIQPLYGYSFFQEKSFSCYLHKLECWKMFNNIDSPERKSRFTIFASFQGAALSDFQPSCTHISWCPWKWALEEGPHYFLGAMWLSSVCHCQTDIFMSVLYMISFGDGSGSFWTFHKSIQLIFNHFLLFPAMLYLALK